MDVEKVVVITPVYNESREMILKLLIGFMQVQSQLAGRGVELLHFFLDDDATHLPPECQRLVTHTENQQLARTLLDGYSAVLEQHPDADVVIRMDCQEHDPAMIPRIIDAFRFSPVQALFLPVCYWVAGQPRPLMRQITQDIADFTAALSPVKSEKILRVYNQKFPLGFQAFTLPVITRLLPMLERGYEVFEQRHGRPSWGFDLLAIILAANLFPGEIDFLFGGWMPPWEENRPAEKIEAQRRKAEAIVDVAIGLGCKTV